MERVVTRPLIVRAGLSGTRQGRLISRVLRIIKLARRRTSQCTRRFDNNRHRQVNVTETLVVGPGLVVTSRPISTLSISVRSRVLGLLGSLRARFGLACLFVSRSLDMIRRVDSDVKIVCLNAVIRSNPGSIVFSGPLRPCAGTLLSSIPIPSPQLEERQVILRKSLPDPIGPPSKYHFRAEYPTYVSVYEAIRPRIGGKLTSSRFITYRLVS